MTKVIVAIRNFGNANKY